MENGLLQRTMGHYGCDRHGNSNRQTEGSVREVVTLPQRWMGWILLLYRQCSCKCLTELLHLPHLCKALCVCVCVSIERGITLFVTFSKCFSSCSSSVCSQQTSCVQLRLCKWGKRLWVMTDDLSTALLVHRIDDSMSDMTDTMISDWTVSFEQFNHPTSSVAEERLWKVGTPHHQSIELCSASRTVSDWRGLLQRLHPPCSDWPAEPPSSCLCRRKMRQRTSLQSAESDWDCWSQTEPVPPNLRDKGRASWWKAVEYKRICVIRRHLRQTEAWEENQHKPNDP